MIEEAVKLESDLFEEENLEKEPVRNGYREGLVEAGRKNEDVVALSADLKGSTRAKKFAEEFPERFFNVGVAEQNMVTIASGLGASGKIPFVSSYAVFNPGRNWEQIRTTISYNDSNVKIAGHHAGISTAPDGATHQAIEDIATMRVMANMRVFVPCDKEEARKATLAAADIMGPVYIRFARPDTPVFTTEETPFKPGRAQVFWNSDDPDVLVVTCGAFPTYNALEAAKALDDEEVIVLNSPSVKPLDERKIVELASKAGAVVSVEEHNVLGGLGSAVSELLAKKNPVPQEFIGMQDEFGESARPGELDDLIEKYNMSTSDIVEAVKRVVERK